MKILAVLSLVVGYASVSLAQQVSGTQSAAELPSGPLLNPAPDFSQWTIIRKGSLSTNAGGQSAGKSDIIDTIQGGKTGDVLHVVTTSGTGRKREIWQKGTSLVIWTTGWERPLVSYGSPQFVFPGFDWISRDKFSEKKKVDDRECWVFRARIFPSGGDENATAEDLNGVDPESLKVPAVACIDAETRLPVTLQVGKQLSTYKIEPLQPRVPLTLPAEAQSAIAAKQLADKAGIRRPVRP